jgi:hypothetical protein
MIPVRYQYNYNRDRVGFAVVGASVPSKYGGVYQ